MAAPSSIWTTLTSTNLPYVAYRTCIHADVALNPATPTDLTEAWISVPKLSSSTPNWIYVYYGNPAAADASNAPAVWSQTYYSVYHLKNWNNATVQDSVSGSIGTKSSSALAEATGKIGKASNMASAYKITLSGYPVIDNAAAFTIEAWSKATSGSLASSRRSSYTGKRSEPWAVFETAADLHVAAGGNQDAPLFRERVVSDLLDDDVVLAATAAADRSRRC